MEFDCHNILIAFNNVEPQERQAHNRTPQRQNIKISMGIYREFDKIARRRLGV